MNKFLLIAGCCLFLTACAPKFEIESKYNEFRQTSVCNMKNNIVKKHNVGGTLFFNLIKDTEITQRKLLAQPYLLHIENRQGFIRFKDDSYLRLTLTLPNGNIETLLLKGLYSDTTCDKSTQYMPGYFSGDYYVPGYVTTNTDYRTHVHYSLNKAQLNKIVDACNICFELETIDETIRATLSEENIKNIQEFKGCCLD